MQLLNQIKSRVRLPRHPAGIWAAMGINAIRMAGLSILFSYLALYIYQQRHISMTLVGTIILISGLLSGVAQIPGGMVADRLGHRRTFIIFQIASIALLGLLAVLIGLNSPVWSIFLISILASMMGGMSSPAVSAMIADISPKDHLTESYGLLSIGLNAGFAIGPLIGGFLVSNTSFGWVFGAGALIAALSLFLVPLLPKDSKAKASERLTGQDFRGFFKHMPVIGFCVLGLLFFLGIGQWGSTLSVFTVDRIGFQAQQYGLLMSIGGILVIIFQYPISSRVEKLGINKALFLGSLCYGIGWLSFTWVKSFLPAIGSVAILDAGEMLVVPTSFSVIGRLSNEKDRAKNMALLGLSITLGESCGPLLGGYLLDRFPANPLYIWGIIAIFPFLAAVGFLLWKGYLKPEKAVTTSRNKTRATS
jgi:MFS family permease